MEFLNNIVHKHGDYFVYNNILIDIFNQFILFFFQGYLPPKIERREDTLTRKRDEYWSYVSQYYHTRTGSEHQDTFRQVIHFSHVEDLFY